MSLFNFSWTATEKLRKINLEVCFTISYEMDLLSPSSPMEHKSCLSNRLKSNPLCCFRSVKPHLNVTQSTTMSTSLPQNHFFSTRKHYFFLLRVFFIRVAYFVRICFLVSIPIIYIPCILQRIDTHGTDWAYHRNQNTIIVRMNKTYVAPNFCTQDRRNAEESDCCQWIHMRKYRQIQQGWNESIVVKKNPTRQYTTKVK